MDQRLDLFDEAIIEDAEVFATQVLVEMAKVGVTNSIKGLVYAMILQGKLTALINSICEDMGVPLEYVLEVITLVGKDYSSDLKEAREIYEGKDH